jgi:hypothetical protein
VASVKKKPTHNSARFQMYFLFIKNVVIKIQGLYQFSNETGFLNDDMGSYLIKISN